MAQRDGRIGTKRAPVDAEPRHGDTVATTKRKRSTAPRGTTRANADAADKLSTYRSKRDFSKTGEPAGERPHRKRTRELQFVVQKHDARNLHFDLRLELDGVMKSWAVPKGPSYDTKSKRLAMEVEDHPIEYNTFEGTIPEGEYGGGTVMIWDHGVYDAEDGGGPDSLRDGYARGDLKVVLAGERLKGGWVLVRMKRPGKPQWLLIKHRDEYARSGYDVVAKEQTSVTTGRTMEQIAGDADRTWSSEEGEITPPRARKKTRPGARRRAAK